MQARSYPPEQSSSVSSHSSGATAAQSRRRSPSSAGSSPSSETPADVLQAAKLGDFRAIASYLNQALAPHEITAWVGEAAPGYLHIILTTKRPPQQEPLIRFISHRLYALHSDVILGANLTVKLVNTNLILWQRVVRLPLPDIYKTPSPLEVWSQTVQTSVQSAWDSSRSQVMEWYGQGRSWLNLPVVTSAPSDPIAPPESPSKSPLESPSVSPSGLSTSTTSDRPDQHPDQHSDQHPGQHQNTSAAMAATAPASGDDESSTPEAPSDLILASTPAIALSAPASSLPQAPSKEEFSKDQSLRDDQTITPQPGHSSQPDHLPQPDHLSTPPSPQTASSSGEWTHPWQTLRQTVTHHVTHPNALVLGGTAIAIFAVGAWIETVNQVFPSNTPSTPSSRSSDSPQGFPFAPSGDPANNPEPTTNEPETASRRTTRSSLARPSVIETDLGELEVVPLSPTTASLSEVTLTISNQAIVPLPPLEEPEPQRQSWLWPFRDTPAQPTVHEADLSMALLNTPPMDDTPTDAAIAVSTLKQGGIDLVNVAGSGVAKGQPQSLPDTLDVLAEADIPHVGGGRDRPSASQPRIFEIKGQRIAVLGYADTYLYAANAANAGTNPGSRRRVAADIEALRNHVDWVIVSYAWHDGDGAPTPSDAQMELARFAVDQGADVVVGHHPSLMQGGEIYKGKAIAYSIGPIPMADTAIVESSGRSQLAPDTPEASSNNPVQNVPHQLPESGVRSNLGEEHSVGGDTSDATELETTPEDTASTVSPSDATPGAEPHPSYATALLKIVLGDRHMTVGFVPVYHGTNGATYLEGKEAKTVMNTIRSASASFDQPLSSNGMAHLPLERDVRSFSNSAAETFQPSNADAFIGGDGE